jgi:pimeloyl-ACP methyl ester carboxylesterase
MRQGKLILLTGLAGDHRLFPFRIPDTSIETPDYIEPASGESLVQYAGRLGDHFHVGPDDVIGGASFGGMAAAEIARQRPVAGLILLGSCIHPKRLPCSYRLIEKIGPLIPNALLALRTFRPLIRFRFSPLTHEAEDCLIQMTADCPMSRVREFGRMLMAWPGADGLTCPLLSIHGDKDKIIPPRCAEPGVVLRDAGHAFTLTHPEQAAAAIQEFLSKNP